MKRSTRQLLQGLTVALGGVLLAVAALNPASAQQAPVQPPPYDIVVTAEVVETNTPIGVEATGVTSGTPLPAAGTGGYSHASS